MVTTSMHVTLVETYVVLARLIAISIRLSDIVTAALWLTGFLCLLNIALAIYFRKRGMVEVLSYYAACALELLIFVAASLFHLGVISRVPYPLPPGLPFNRAEIGVAVALAIGLFPAAYWHRASFSELPARIEKDAKTMNQRDGGVRVRSTTLGEWMN